LGGWPFSGFHRNGRQGIDAADWAVGETEWVLSLDQRRELVNATGGMRCAFPPYLAVPWTLFE
jgi:hypothetical protein